MKIFMTYYILSGLITARIAYKDYDAMVEDIPLLRYINKEVLVFIQFLTGFLQLPFICILKIQGLFLDVKISRLEKETKRLKDKIELNKKTMAEAKEAKITLAPHIRIEDFASEDKLYTHIISKMEISLGDYIGTISWVIIYHEEAKYFSRYYLVIKDNLISFCVENTLKDYIKDKWIVTVTIENPYYKPQPTK